MVNAEILRWAKLVAGMEEGRNYFKMLTGKLIRNRPLPKPRHSWGVYFRIGLIVVRIRSMEEPL